MGTASRPLLALLAALALAGGAGACGSGDPVERVGGGGGNAPTLDTDPLAPLPGETVTVPAPGTAVTTPPAAASPAATASTPAATTPPSSATTGGAEAQGDDDTSTTGGAQAQDEGDATFVIDAAGSLGPAGVPVPSTVPITVTVRNEDDVPHQVTVLLEDRPERTIAAGASATFPLDALAPGSYTMLLDGGGSAAVLQVGPNQGP